MPPLPQACTYSTHGGRGVSAHPAAPVLVVAGRLRRGTRRRPTGGGMGGARGWVGQEAPPPFARCLVGVGRGGVEAKGGDHRAYTASTSRSAQQQGAHGSTLPSPAPHSAASPIDTLLLSGEGAGRGDGCGGLDNERRGQRGSPAPPRHPAAPPPRYRLCLALRSSYLDALRRARRGGARRPMCHDHPRSTVSGRQNRGEGRQPLSTRWFRARPPPPAAAGTRCLRRRGEPRPSHPPLPSPRGERVLPSHATRPGVARHERLGCR